jgi:hypothetical protein
LLFAHSTFILLSSTAIVPSIQKKIARKMISADSETTEAQSKKKKKTAAKRKSSVKKRRL